MHRIYLLLAALALCGAVISGAYLKGRMDSKNAAQIKTLTENANTREKLNEIRNRRPDDAELIDRLRSGKF